MLGILSYWEWECSIGVQVNCTEWNSETITCCCYYYYRWVMFRPRVSFHRTLPSTSCCTPETSRATNRWWRGKNVAAGRPVDPPGFKNTHTLTHRWRVGRRLVSTTYQRQTEGRLSLRGFHAWMATEQTATPLPSARHVTAAMSFISFSVIKKNNDAVASDLSWITVWKFISLGQCVPLQCGSLAIGGQCNTGFSARCRTSER